MKGSVSGRLNSVVLGLFGVRKLDVAVQAEVQSGRLIEGEIVLVLDYSSSMNSSGKYQAMRDAAIDLVRTISRDYTIPTVQFALVPFAGHVYGSLPSDYVVNEAPGSTWTNCTKDRKWAHNTSDATPFPADDATKWGMAAGGGGDDDDDDDDDDRSGSAYGDCHNYPSRDLVIAPLTNRHRRIVRQLEAMTPYQGTHISLGLEFGWHVLSPNAPWQEGSAYGETNKIKSIVLLTDGRQTAGAWGAGESNSSTNGERNLEDMCAAIKDQDVLMITVAFDLQDAATETGCATARRLRPISSMPIRMPSSQAPSRPLRSPSPRICISANRIARGRRAPQALP